MLLAVLGPLTAEVDGEAVPIPAGMQRTLLAALLHRVRRPVSVETLTAALWPDDPPSKPDKALQLYVHRLRRLLGDPRRVLYGPAGYSLIASRSELDWQRFEDRLRAAREARHRGDGASATARYDEALALWRSEAYEDVPDRGLLAPEVQRLSNLRTEARVERAEAMVDGGRHAEADAVISQLLTEYPHREGLYASLMLARYRAGRVADALAVYRRARELLARELGVEPGPKLAGVHRAILNRSPRLDSSAAPATAPVPAQLPAPIATLAGRQDELAELLRPTGTGRAVVRAIDGMAGVGKSTLAVYAAHRLADRYPDGQLFADLRGHTPGVEPSDPGEVLGRLLEGLGVTGDRLPHDPEARTGLWRGLLRDKRMLIVLDNAVDSAQVRPLLPGADGCLVLVTGRARLTELDDADWLSLDVLPREAARRLFSGVVGAARLADTAALAEVLSVCGGLPLALRLTAARFRDRPSWTLDQLVERLRRARPEVLGDDRHGVASAFGVAYERLPWRRRLLFLRLALHPGVDIDAGAAAALADESDVVDDLEALVDAHLLQSTTFGRYRFHDLMRRYAAALADAEPQTEPRAALRRQLDHYLQRVRAAVTAARLEPVLRPLRLPLDAAPGPDTEAFDGVADAMAWLDAERANLVAVTRRAAESGLTEPVVAMSWLLCRYLSFGGHVADALTVQREAVTATAERAEAVAHAVTRYQLGNVYVNLGRRDEALSHFEAALATFRTEADTGAEAVLLHALGNVTDQAGRFDESQRYRRRSLESATAAADRVGQCRARLGLGLALRGLRRYADSRVECEAALAIAVELGLVVYQASAHEIVGQLDLDEDRPTAAVPRLTTALELYREAGNRRGEYQCHNGLGRARGALGEPDAALRQQRLAMAIIDTIDDPNAELEGHLFLGEALAAVGRTADAREHLNTALGLAERYRQPTDEQRVRSALDRLEPQDGRRGGQRLA